jgi:hypothetical protein
MHARANTGGKERQTTSSLDDNGIIIETVKDYYFDFIARQKIKVKNQIIKQKH